MIFGIRPEWKEMTRYGERHAVLATTGDSFILSHIWHIRIYTFFHLNSFLLFVILVFLLGIILEHFIYIFVWNIRFQELSFSGGSYRGVQKLQMCWNSVMIFSILSVGNSSRNQIKFTSHSTNSTESQFPNTPKKWLPNI